MALTLRTQLPVEEAARRVTDAIVNGSFSAELVAQSDSRGPDGAQCVTLLFDKYFRQPLRALREPGQPLGHDEGLCRQRRNQDRPVRPVRLGRGRRL